MVKQMQQVQDYNGREADDSEIQGLEMRGGLGAGVRYPANYVHAPKSMFPIRSDKYADKWGGPNDAMEMVLKAK